MIIPDKILREYRVTEKAANLAANLNQYTFEVAPNANRKEIAEAVEKLFNVKVINVNTLNQEGKVKRFRNRPGKRASFKKAFVKLAEGNTIDTSVEVK